MKIDDLARLAHVSKSTVSIALNGKPGISEEKRNEIIELAKKYNYIPLRKTKTKKTKQNYSVRFVACTNSEIITDNFQDLPYFSDLLKELSSELVNYPFTLILNTLSSEQVINEIKKLEEHQPTDAILLLGTNLSSAEIQEFETLTQNLVVIDTCLATENIDFVTMNNYQGAYLATQHLIDNGHKQIAYAMGIPRIENFQERFRGYKDALENNHLCYDEESTIQLPAMTFDKQERIIHHFKGLTKLPSAIFCENDYMAISIIKSLRDLSIKIPEDISIIGFDDISESSIIYPELSTINVDRKAIIKAALNKLLEKLKIGSTYSSHQLINTTLVTRNSIKKLIVEKKTEANPLVSNKK